MSLRRFRAAPSKGTGPKHQSVQDAKGASWKARAYRDPKGGDAYEVAVKTPQGDHEVHSCLQTRQVGGQTVADHTVTGRSRSRLLGLEMHEGDPPDVENNDIWLRWNGGTPQLRVRLNGTTYTATLT